MDNAKKMIKKLKDLLYVEDSSTLYDDMISNFVVKYILPLPSKEIIDKSRKVINKTSTVSKVLIALLIFTAIWSFIKDQNEIKNLKDIRSISCSPVFHVSIICNAIKLIINIEKITEHLSNH